MGGLFSTLRNTAETIRAYDSALTLTQRNISNANTAGYAKQVGTFVATATGSKAGPTLSTRNEYAEVGVRRLQSGTGAAQQRVTQLSSLQTSFPVASDAALPQALTKLFGSFSNWSTAPSDSAARQQVLDRAGELAASFQQSGMAVGQQIAAGDQQIDQLASQINSLSAQLKDLNVQLRQNAQLATDPAVGARVTNVLQSLSELTDITALPQADGSVTVYASAQVPLVIGDEQFAIAVQHTGTAATLQDSVGRDITATLTGGRLGASIALRNTTLADAQTGLDQLASTVADQVNQLLASGADAAGVSPGQPLFTYNPASAASTLSVTNITAANLASGTVTAPAGNGTALQLVALGTAKVFSGTTLQGGYGQLAAKVGQQLAGARDEASSQEDLLTQAESLRDSFSRVSLDEEATKLIELQRGFQATAKLVGVLNDLTDVVLGILR